MNIELNFFPHYGTNYVFVVDNSLKKTNKHQLHLLKVKSKKLSLKAVGGIKCPVSGTKLIQTLSNTPRGGGYSLY